MDSKGKVSVLDFGLCDIVESRESFSSNFCGSLDYVAPEVITSKQYSGYKSDIYSLGVVLYTLLYAEFPFVSSVRVDAIKKKANQPAISFDKLLGKNVGKDAKDLITNMLRANPKERISMQQVFKHSYIRKEKEMEQKLEQDKPYSSA